MAIGTTIKSYIKQTIGPRNLAMFRAIKVRPDLILPTTFRSSKYGFDLTGDQYDVTYVLALRAGYGDFLPSIIRSLPTDTTFVDIGSNIGIFSLIAGRHLQHGLVFAFEPNLRTYHHLVRNIFHSKLTNVFPFNVALSNEPTHLQSLSVFPGHSGRSSLQLHNETSVTALTVAGRELDGVIADHGYIAMKIDVEGHELAVLEGLVASRTFDRTRWLVLEVSEPIIGHDGIAALQHFLDEHGFKLKSQSNPGRHRDELYVRATVQ